MEKNTVEEQRGQIRRENRKKKKQKKQLLIPIAIVVAVIALAVILIVWLTGDSYNDKESFQKYAEASLESMNKDMEKSDTAKRDGTVKIDAKYGTPCSAAAEYPSIKNKEVEKRMRMAVDERVKRFKTDNEHAAEEDTLALLAGSKAYVTPKEAIGLVIYEVRQKEDGRKMEDTSATAHPYNFSTKTGMPLAPTQIFENKYRTFCSKFFTSYFEKNNKKELAEDKYKDTLSDSEKNFNKFVLTDSGVKFFFDAGTVLNKSEGVVTADVTYKELSGTIREEIIVRYIDPKKPMVALTYDDGPYPSSSNRILDTLEKHGVIATFFELGKNVKAYPDVVKRKSDLGMEIGSHTWSHPNLGQQSESKVKEQIDKTSDEVKKVTGHIPTVFRPPYGISNKIVEKHVNAPIILWSVDTLDWKSKNADSVNKVIKGVKDLDGRVILLHSIHESTAEATEELVPWLLDEGYQLVTVSELLEYRYKEIPKKGKMYGYGYFYVDKK